MARGRGSSKDKQAVKPAAETPKERFELLLENIEQQNRAVMDAVHAQGNELRREMREGFEKLAARADVHELSLRQHSADIRGLKTDVQGLKTDVRELKTKVGKLEEAVERIEVKLDQKADVSQVKALEARVAVLEGQ